VQKIKELKGILNRDTMARDCSRPVTRSEAMVKVGGDFIK
jgi:hypothetical protein